MPSDSTITTEKARVEQELLSKENEIKQDVNALQEEVTSIAPSVRDAIFNHPLVSVGGALLAGLVVGLLFGGKKRSKDSYGAGTDHRALVDHYVTAIVDEARKSVGKGEDVGEAIRSALKERVPLIVYEVPEAKARNGLMRYLAYIAARQFVPLGIKMGMDFLAGDDVNEVEPHDPGEQ